MVQKISPSQRMLRAEIEIASLARDTDTARIERMANSPIPFRRAGAAENRLLSTSSLARLARDPIPRVVLGVARNPMTEGMTLQDASITLVCGLTFSEWPNVQGSQRVSRRIGKLGHEIGEQIRENNLEAISEIFARVINVFKESSGECGMLEFSRWMEDNIDNGIRVQALMEICTHRNVMNDTHRMLLALGYDYLSGPSRSTILRGMKFDIVSVASIKMLREMRESERDKGVIRRINEELRKRVQEREQ